MTLKHPLMTETAESGSEPTALLESMALSTSSTAAFSNTPILSAPKSSQKLSKKSSNSRVTTSAALGRWAENQAAMLLLQQGWQILQRNYHSRYGEIDLIAMRNSELIMLEVKARSLGSYALAVEVVSRAKQQKLIKTAMLFLQAHPQYDQYAVRFDVICFDFTEKIAKTVQHNFAQFGYDVQWIENAFTLDF